MILYLSRKESANLLYNAASDKSLHIRKISGNLFLSEFIIRDMWRFASCRFFCVERIAITENDAEFLEALKSFQIMYSATRVIVIHESIYEIDSLTRGLIQIGVTDIITASDIREKLSQIFECLSGEGMLRYKPTLVNARDTEPYEENEDNEGKEGNKENKNKEKETLAQSIIINGMEDEHYRFDCVNVNIGIIGATRRVEMSKLN